MYKNIDRYNEFVLYNGLADMLLRVYHIKSKMLALKEVVRWATVDTNHGMGYTLFH